MKRISQILFVAWLSATSTLFAQTERYSRAKILLEGRSLLELARLGLAVDHGEYKTNAFFVSDFSESEIRTAREAGFFVETLIEDVSKFYEEQNYGLYKTADDIPPLFDCRNDNPFYPQPSGFSLGTMGGFLKYEEVMAQLDAMHAAYPHLISPKTPIDSAIVTHEGRPIYYLRISDNPLVDEDEPEILFDALHHSREPATVTNQLFFMWWILENYETNPEIRYLVEHTEMYFVPVVNPDGLVRNQTTNPNGGGMWRKNRRNNGGSYGVDLNRNYGFQWGLDDTGSSPNPSSDVYRGPGPFSEPETQAIRKLCNEHAFGIALNYHTYGNSIVYPWGYAPSLFTPDSTAFRLIANLLTEENGYLHGTGDQTVGYFSNGDSDDWMYGEQTEKNKILAFTPEAGESFWPPSNQILRICRQNVLMHLRAAHLVNYYPRLEDLSGPYLDSVHTETRFSFERVGLRDGGTYTVSVEPLTANIVAVGSPVVFEDPAYLQYFEAAVTLQLQTPIATGEPIRFVLACDNGLYTFRDTLTKYFGQPQTVVTESSNLGDDWQSSGSWNITANEFHTPPFAYTSNTTANYANNLNRTLTLAYPVDLSEAQAAYAEFYAKWELEADYDYVQFEAKVEATNDWQALCGLYTTTGTSNQAFGEPLYDAYQPFWVRERFDLSPYLGQQIRLRFQLVTDPAETRKGFRFDDFSVNVLRYASFTGDTIPTDTIPTDTVPTDTVPNAWNTWKYKIRSNVVEHFPNPVAGETTFRYYLDAPYRNLRLELYDARGERMRSVVLPDSQTDRFALDLSDLPSGTYFYRLVSNSKSITAIGKLTKI